MIRELSIVNSLNERLDCELACPEKSGFAITKIDGLGPNDIDLKTTQIASGSGYFINKKMNKYREIKIEIRYYEYNDNNLSVEELRKKCYKYMQRGEEVSVYIGTDMNTYVIKGCVSKNEETIFSNTCGAVVTIMCPMPYFYEKGFEYRKKIRVHDGALTLSTSFNEVYPGEGNSYPEISIELMDGTAPYVGGITIKISNVDGEKGIKLITPRTLNIGRDIIKFSFDPKNFHVYLVQNGETTDISEYCDFIDQKDRGGLISLTKGKNTFSFDRIDELVDAPHAYFDISYPVMHAGV